MESFQQKHFKRYPQDKAVEVSDRKIWEIEKCVLKQFEIELQSEVNKPPEHFLFDSSMIEVSK